MFSRVRNVMEALLTQNNDGDIVKYVNELLPLLKILPIYHHLVEKHWKLINKVSLSMCYRARILIEEYCSLNRLMVT